MSVQILPPLLRKASETGPFASQDGSSVGKLLPKFCPKRLTGSSVLACLSAVGRRGAGERPHAFGVTCLTPRADHPPTHSPPGGGGPRPS
jgi:hypothetical protein